MENRKRMACAVASGLVLAACGGGNSQVLTPPVLPRLSQATAGTLKGVCTDFSGFAYAGLQVTSVTTVAAGTLSVGTTAIGAHCRVLGKLNERVSAVDGQTYAIGFEMRLPLAWSGRYFYQGNGGTDGAVATASGAVGSGGPLANALSRGFAVISSDAGHSSAQNPLFGLDPVARTDYGYGAVGKLTPMAKELVKAAYGRYPDRSYIGGTSNGGRHTMVAATRYAADYDGFLANSPGFDLPLAAAAQLYTAQQLRKVATDETDLGTAFTLAERKLVAGAILGRCDALDGARDGLVQDVEACRTAFNLLTDVPTCTAARDGSCLSAAQKTAIAALYAGPVNSRGEALYATQPFDPGLVGASWASWKFVSSVGAARDPVAVGVIFQVPPNAAMVSDTRAFAFNYNFDTDFPRLTATNATFTENSLQFMTPPTPSRLDTLRDRGAKMIVIHGVSDGPFANDDTRRWYESVMAANTNGGADRFVRFYRVPGMNHSSGGTATDQYDALDSLIQWVESGVAPDTIVASARGAGNAGGVNAELPVDWSPTRTRPLCPYPLVARYDGVGDIERAASFGCKP